MQIIKYVFLFGAFLLLVPFANAQRVGFSGTARNVLENNYLDNSDTLNSDRNATGYTFADLNFDIKPNGSTEIQAQLRLRNEYGGYWGDGASVTFRQIYMRGVIANRLKYQIGDLNYQLTPYTFYNTETEGNVNEASTFKMFRELVEYDNFNLGNTWRQQGLFSEIRLHDDVLYDTLIVNGFVGRNRGNRLADLADIIQNAASAKLYITPNFMIGGNYAQLVALGTGRLDTTAFNNQIASANWKLQKQSEKVGYWFSGEAGASRLVFTNDKNAPKDAQDYFYEAQLGIKLKDYGLTFSATYREVGAEFFSAAAQTKRINFNQKVLRFATVTNQSIARPISTWDLVRDNSLYNLTITPSLMAFDPRLGVARPYGLATPNRRGINFAVDYQDKKRIWLLQATYAGLMEVKDEGVESLKRNFGVFQTKGNVAVGRWIGWDKALNISWGYQYEQVQRGGTPIETINLTNQTVDLGLDIEVLPQLDINLGFRKVQSAGNEILNVRDGYNVIRFYRLYNVKSTENIWGYGVRYRFSQYAYVSVQNHVLELIMQQPTNSSYQINQVSCLFNMQF
jgi:hypothetical protein